MTGVYLKISLVLVAAACLLFIVTGAARAGKFCGARNVTRYEICSAVACIARKAGVLSDRGCPLWTALDDVDAYRISDVAAVIDLELLQAVEGRFYGEKSISRLQLAVLAYRLVRLLRLPKTFSGPPSLPVDLPLGYSGRAKVLDVVNRGLLELDDGRFRPFDLVNRTEFYRLCGRLVHRLSLPKLYRVPALDDLPGGFEGRRLIRLCYQTGVISPSDEKALDARALARVELDDKKKYGARFRKEKLSAVRQSLRSILKRHSLLSVRLSKLETRAALGDNSIARPVFELDEELIAVNFALFRLAQEPGLLKAAGLSVRFSKLVDDVRRSRWRIRGLLKKCVENR